MNPHRLCRPLALLLACMICSRAIAQTTRPIEQVNHVLIISIDGLRPDVLLRANTPNLRHLMDSGSFTLWAQTVPMAITLPSHVSMLTGVSVAKHGITFNDERATTRPFYPDATTLFEAAHSAGLSTALVTGKSKFMALNKPGSIDWYVAPTTASTTDDVVIKTAIPVIRDHQPRVMFLHFPGADAAGHAYGWDSPQQIEAVSNIDIYIGQVLQTLQQTRLADSTVVIVSADHGGAGKTHGANDTRSLEIPWIANGPGIRKNVDLTMYRDLTVHTEDTFATACYLMGIPLPPRTDGKPVTQIVDRAELLQETPK